MNREEAIKLANDMAFMASIWVDDEGNEINDLVKFAQLVAAKEREACAKLVEANADACVTHGVAQMCLYSNASAIRARGEA